jgi:hypothetical protein
VRAILTANAFGVPQSQVGFIDEGSGLQWMGKALAAHVATREPMEFLIYEWDQLVECARIPVAPRSQ